jgi:hypothetical protein
VYHDCWFDNEKFPGAHHTAGRLWTRRSWWQRVRSMLAGMVLQGVQQAVLGLLAGRHG